MEELDIWRSANLLIMDHGKRAPFIATQLADALLGEGNREGSSAWIRIRRAIKDFQRPKPRAGETVN
jgi:hypothetical protein